MINQELIDFANQLADLSAQVIKKYFRQDCGEVAKGDNSPVTLADKEAEKVIRKAIQKHFPQHGIIGEEFENINKDADYQWVIDPIDGTTSFIIGRPTFGTLIALTYKGQSLLGIVNQPISRERWIGIKGQGAYLNGKKIKVRNCSSLNDAVLCTTSPYYFKGQDLQLFQKVTSQTKYQKSGGMILGGDCYSYALLASGFVDIIIESGLNNYDYTALIPIIQEAGGVITDWQGSELGLKSDGRVLACGDREVHQEVLLLFKL